MTRLQKYLDACMHTSANTHSLELTIILSCTPNILLVISRTSVLIIYSFCAEFILEYSILANFREITKGRFFLRKIPSFCVLLKKLPMRGCHVMCSTVHTKFQFNFCFYHKMTCQIFKSNCLAQKLFFRARARVCVCVCVSVCVVSFVRMGFLKKKSMC